MNALILIIDDEENLRKTLAEIFRARNYQVTEAADGTEAMALLHDVTPDLILTDWKMPDAGGEEILKYLRNDPRLELIPVIVITAFGTSHVAIEAVRLGAYDFVTKPFDLQEISLTVDRALAHTALSQEVTRLRRQVERNAPAAGRLIGCSQPMLDLFKMIGKVSDTDSTVLISGESGTGKQLVAEAIHEHSRRKDKPFVVVNCATLPENLLESELFGHEKGAFTGAIARKTGRFEIAEGGAIFLDEIAELPLGLQAKLLQVLQEHTFQRLGGTDTIKGDFRVLAATNRDLEACIREGLFREDLFYRLNVVRISLTPLRERRSDIVPLAEHFLRIYSESNGVSVVGFSDEAILMLQTYSYPGNVRELENMIERAVVMARGRVLMPTHFPAPAQERQGGLPGSEQVDFLELPFHRAVADLERTLIENALRAAAGNKTEAANKLQINRRLLYNKMVEHKIEE
jgi:two-component system response regulator AtoC